MTSKRPESNSLTIMSTDRQRPMRGLTSERWQLWAVAICMLCLFGSHPRLAFGQQSLRPLPSVLRTLSDEVGVLSSEEAVKLGRLIEEIQQRTGVQVLIVVTESTTPETTRDYAERVALRWERERSIDLDHSIFIVVALRDREMLVLPGNGVSFLDEEFARPGAFDDLAPLFRDRREFEALMKLNRRILDALMKRSQAKPVTHYPGCRVSSFLQS